MPEIFLAASAYGRKMMCRPSADTENSRRTREKPLLPRVKNRQLRQNATQAIFSSGRSVGLNLGLKRWKKKSQWAPFVGTVNKGTLFPAPEICNFKSARVKTKGNGSLFYFYFYCFTKNFFKKAWLCFRAINECMIYCCHGYKIDPLDMHNRFVFVTYYSVG